MSLDLVHYTQTTSLHALNGRVLFDTVGKGICLTFEVPGTPEDKVDHRVSRPSGILLPCVPA
jgi:hypothetical protein